MTKKDVIEAIPIRDLENDDILVVRVPVRLEELGAYDFRDVHRSVRSWLEAHGLAGVLLLTVPEDVALEKLSAEQLDRVGLMRTPQNSVRQIERYWSELLGYIVRFVASGSVLGIMPVQREGEPTHLCLGMVGKTEVFPTRAGAEIAIRATVDWRNKGPVPCAKEDEYEILALVRERQ